MVRNSVNSFFKESSSLAGSDHAVKGVKNVRKVRGVASVVVCVLAASSGVPAQTRQWNGTVVLTRNASATYKESTAAATDTMNDVLTETITVTIGNGKAEATIDYLLKQHVDGIRNDEIANRTVTIWNLSR